MDKTVADITYEQNLRIQRALLKQKRDIDNNKVVAVVLVVIAVMALI
jgi:hypothetical protein